ncbi:MAG: SRPBCC family protein [Cyanobacteria bacterium J06641_5]
MFARFCTTACSLAIATLALNGGAPTRANVFDTPLKPLPVAERVALREGQPVLTEVAEGRYVARVLLEAPVETVWDVLTDYGNYDEFLPNVVSSEITSNDGAQKTVEQVSVGRAFVFSKQARSLSEIREKALQQIDFRLLEGDLKTSRGSWKLDAFSTSLRGPDDLVLVTYTIEIDPGKTFSRGIFFNVFEEAIVDTLSAITTEVETRLE